MKIKEEVCEDCNHSHKKEVNRIRLNNNLCDSHVNCCVDQMVTPQGETEGVCPYNLFAGKKSVNLKLNQGVGFSLTNEDELNGKIQRWEGTTMTKIVACFCVYPV